MTKYVETDNNQFVPLDDAETAIAERYYIIAGFAALISGLVMPSTGVLGAMLVTFCCMVPMTQRFWANKRFAGLGLGAIACLVQAPVIYGLTLVISLLAKLLLP